MVVVDTPHDGLIEVYNPTEGIDIIIDTVLNSNICSKKSGTTTTEYACVVASFDIETTKTLNLNWCSKDAECFKWFNVCFCWQFMINDKFIFGRYIGEYFDMMQKVNKALGEIKFVVFIHNINFEFGNLVDYFKRDAEEMFFKNSSTPLFIRQYSCEYRCSRQLTHKSLAMLGKELGYPKLVGDFDYTVERNTETELTPLQINYCYRDCKILNLYIAKETANYCKGKKQECSALLPYTQTGYPRADIKTAFSYTWKGKQILENTALPYNTYLALRRAFWGGFTHANFRIIGKAIKFNSRNQLLHIDITSAYPWALVTQKFPYTMTCEPNPSEAEYIELLKDERIASVAEVTLYKVWLKKGRIPYIPYGKGSTKQTATGAVSENGKLIYADAITITACDIDMNLIMDAYEIDSITIHKLYTGFKRPLPYSVVSTILKYFEGKTTLKGIEELLYEYGLSKQKLNGIFGVSAQDLCHDEYILNDDLEVISKNIKYEPAKVLPYQWCIYCTAYVRRVIVTIAERFSKEFLYSDTDSVFARRSDRLMQYVEEYNERIKQTLYKMRNKYFNIIPVSPKGEPQYLGTLTEEEDDAVEFCTIGAKRYYIVHSDNTATITFSGLRATKREKNENGDYINGYNTNRLITRYGSLNKAFNEIKDGSVYLEYVEGIDKLSNYNVRADFRGIIDGIEYKRPCSYTLYPQATNLSLNSELYNFLNNEEIIYNEVM